MNTTLKRNSCIELLRIFCILGILCMHFSGVFTQSNNFLTIVQLNIINSLFNTCVTCFILISGYFGITRNFRKLFSLWCIVIFYSLSGAVVSTLTSGELDLVFIFKSVFPTITNKYWYYTTYVLLVLFAPYINKIPEKLSKKEFQALLALLIAIFYICPTFFYFEILKDNGKGPVNMLIVYLIGRYLYTYKECVVSRVKAVLCLATSCLIAFILNMGTSIIREYSFAPFARDNSIFMLISAISIFIIFNSITFDSAFINKYSKNIFAAYISESILRNIVNTYFPLTSMDGKWYMFVAILVLALLSFSLLTIFEELRKLIFRYPENFAYTYISRCCIYVSNKLLKIFS